MVSGRKNNGQIYITVTRKFYSTVMAPWLPVLYRNMTFFYSVAYSLHTAHGTRYEAYMEKCIQCARAVFCVFIDLTIH